MPEAKISIKDYFHAINITKLASLTQYPDVFRPRGAASEQTGSSEKIVKTSCRACIANCGVFAHVRDGRVVNLEGNPDDPMSKGRLCAKGLAGIQTLYHPCRNKYPLQRVGNRGENKWKRISWDEAIDTIANKLMEAREAYGAESVLASTGGGGNPQQWSIVRFCNIFGSPNWFEPGSAQCYLPRFLAYQMIYGGPSTSIADSNAQEIYFPDYSPIKSLTLWGSGPSYSCPATGGRAVVELRARGVKTVVVDPRLTPDAAKADVWLPIRPGTDVALMLAWIHYIIDNKLYDYDFVLKWSNLPYLVDVETKMFLRSDEGADADNPDTYMVWDTATKSAKPLAYPWDDDIKPELMGTYIINDRIYKTGFQLLWERAKPYTLAKAAEICRLDKDKIAEAIRLFAENTPGGLALGVATDQAPNSVQAAMGAATIDVLLGNVEKPGCLLQRFRPSGMKGMGMPISTDMLPTGQLTKRLGGNEYKGLHIWWAAHIPTIFDAIMTGEPYQPHILLDRSGNKMSVLAESDRWVEAFEKLDLIVHMYTFPTSFSSYADILLPAVEWLETNSIVGGTCNVISARQAVTHLWDTMDETLFWAKLAKRCAELGHENCQKSFDKSVMGDSAYWNTVEEFHDQCLEPLGMTWQELCEKTPYQFLPVDEWKQHYVYLQNDPGTGKLRGFDTPSKKLEVYLESMITLARTGAPFAEEPLPPASKDYEPLPYYMEPAESLLRDDALSREYPLVMTNGRIPFYHHSTLRNVPLLREMSPVPELWIHPSAAKMCDVSDGDWVWVESLRAKIRAKAMVTTGIQPETVFMERFWNPETLNTKTQGWKEMNVNRLSRASAPFNDVVGTYTLRGYQVKVFKAEGPPDNIWTKPEDLHGWLPLVAGATKEVRG